MKRLSVYLVVVVFALTALIAGCAKQPTQELNDAKAVIDAVVAEGAEKYAKDDVKTLNDALAAAQDEIKTQDQKFLKNYKKATEMLVDVKAKADALKAELPAKKEKAKNDAIAAQADAKTAVGEAKALLAKAPKGKGTRADIDALKADVAGLETSLTEVHGLIDSEDYIAAAEKANAIKEKSAEVSEQINEALAKVGKKK